MRGQGSDDVVPMMTGLTGVRLKVEFSFYKQTKQTDVFLSFPFLSLSLAIHYSHNWPKKICEVGDENV